MVSSTTPIAKLCFLTELAVTNACLQLAFAEKSADLGTYHAALRVLYSDVVIIGNAHNYARSIEHELKTWDRYSDAQRLFYRKFAFVKPSGNGYSIFVDRWVERVNKDVKAIFGKKERKGMASQLRTYAPLLRLFQVNNVSFGKASTREKKKTMELTLPFVTTLRTARWTGLWSPAETFKPVKIPSKVHNVFLDGTKCKVCGPVDGASAAREYTLTGQRFDMDVDLDEERGRHDAPVRFVRLVAKETKGAASEPRTEGTPQTEAMVTSPPAESPTPTQPEKRQRQRTGKTSEFRRQAEDALARQSRDGRSVRALQFQM